MNVHTKGKEPLYYQLYLSMVKDIQQGIYKENEKLPSKRAFSDYLGVSQNTIDAAYQMLVTEGYIRALPRSGFYVNPLEASLTVRQEPVTSVSISETGDIQNEYQFHLSTNFVDVETFPYATWAKLSKEIMYSQPDLIYPGNQKGDFCLRQAIADYLHKYRSVHCTAAQIIVGAGIEYLLMILNVLFDSDSLFAMENPGYPKVYQTITNCGRTVEAIDVTETGIDIAALGQSKADIVYVTPSHQFPTGVVMPIGKRLELLRWADEKQNLFVIEDDYDSELKFTGKPIPSLQGIDTAGKVAYIGTFSRSIAPSVRIAYLVLPPALLQRYQTLCSYYSPTVSRFEQHTLFQFMKGGHFERNINRNRNTYRKRRDAFVSALKASPIANQITIMGANAGLHFLLQVQNGMSEAELIASAKANGICLQGISPYYLKNRTPMAHTILLGFAHHTPEELQQAANLLASIWKI